MLFRSRSSRGGNAREMISLGEVDLNRDEQHGFKVKELPEGDRFVLGLNLASGSCETLSSDKHVAIRVVDERQRVVIAEDRALKDFRWSKGRDECIPAFGYLHGQGRSTPIGKSGDVCNEPIYTGADYGYGTQFVGRKGAVYTVTLRSYGGTSFGKERVPAQVSLAFDGPHELKSCR